MYTLRKEKPSKASSSQHFYRGRLTRRPFLPLTLYMEVIIQGDIQMGPSMLSRLQLAFLHFYMHDY